MKNSYVLPLLAATSSSAYRNGATLGSCVDVECPVLNPTSADCRVADQMYEAIGLTNFTSDLSGVEMSWTLGYRTYEGNTEVTGEDTERVFEREFYLGTPSSVDRMTSSLPWQACAILLNNTLQYPQDSTPSCSGLLGDACQASLLDAARLATSLAQGDDSAERCSSIASAMDNAILSQCVDATVETRTFGIIASEPLTGSEAPSVLTEEQNSTSNCWPTLPKSNSLTPVFGYNQTGTVRSNSTQPAIDSASLLLTIFYDPSQGSAATPYLPEPHLSCMRPVFYQEGDVEVTDTNMASANLMPKLVLLVSLAATITVLA